MALHEPALSFACKGRPAFCLQETSLAQFALLQAQGLSLAGLA